MTFHNVTENLADEMPMIEMTTVQKDFVKNWKSKQTFLRTSLLLEPVGFTIWVDIKIKFCRKLGYNFYQSRTKNY